MKRLGLGLLALLMASCGSSGGAKIADAAVGEEVDSAAPDPVLESKEIALDPPGEEGLNTEVAVEVAESAEDIAVSDPAPISDLPGEVTDLGPETPAPKNYGFDVRNPGPKDIDHVCHVTYPSVIDGYLYVQATEDKCQMMMGCTYKTLGSWTSVAGEVKPADAVYDFGGNHHNDSIAFSYGGKFFKLYHSFFGPGWRACTPPDCMQVTAGLNGAVLEDGCTEERKLPVQCVEVCPDGTVLEPKDWPACQVDSKWYFELFDTGCAIGQW